MKELSFLERIEPTGCAWRLNSFHFPQFFGALEGWDATEGRDALEGRPQPGPALPTLMSSVILSARQQR